MKTFLVAVSCTLSLGAAAATAPAPTPTISIPGTAGPFIKDVSVVVIAPVLTNTASVSISPDITNQLGLGFDPATGSISGTPDAARSTAYTYTLTAKSAAGAKATASIAITVEDAAPTISFGAAVYTFLMGAKIASFAPILGPSVTKVKIDPNLPSGLSMDGATGKISGTPAVASESIDSTYVVTASNASGQSAAASIEININPVIPPTAPPASTAFGCEYTLSIADFQSTNPGVSGPVVLDGAGDLFTPSVVDGYYHVPLTDSQYNPISDPAIDLSNPNALPLGAWVVIRSAASFIAGNWGHQDDNGSSGYVSYTVAATLNCDITEVTNVKGGANGFEDEQNDMSRIGKAGDDQYCWGGSSTYANTIFAESTTTTAADLYQVKFTPAPVTGACASKIYCSDRTCGPCSAGTECTSASECVTDICTAGGLCGQGGAGVACGGAGDCLNGVCTNGLCTCAAGYGGADCEPFSWRQTGWGPCSVSCGSGTQSGTFSCADADGDVDPTGLICNGSPPASSQACSPGDCSLAFVTQPEAYATACGIDLTSSPSVQVEDLSGNPATSSLTLSAFSDPQCRTPAAGTLLSSQSTAGNIVTFSSLSYGAPTGKAIYLGASAGGGAAGCSQAVTLVGLPSPTVPNTCVMGGTLEPASGATLDCRGQTLVPTAVGIDSPGQTALAYPSVPETAIFFHGVNGATVRNCNLQGFDNAFVLLSANGNQILSNTVKARAAGVYMNNAADNQVIDNSIAWTATEGRAVTLDSETDSNNIADNVITDLGTSGTTHVRLGAPSFPGATTVRDVAIFVIGSYLQLANVYSNGTLYQISNLLDSKVLSSPTATNNVVSGNKVLGTIRLSVSSQDNVVTGNTISGNSTLTGILESSASNVTVTYASSCKNAPARACFLSSDCFIQGFDAVDLGPCGVNSNTAVIVGGSWSNQFLNNTIAGPLSVAISSVGHNTVITGNTITGGVATGIAWAGSKTIQHNQVSALTGMSITINANSGSYDPALTSVSLNDFTGYTTAVKMPANWTTNPTLFSSGGEGNYWGLSCASTNGFDPSKVTGQPAGIVVTDDHPFGVSVAATPSGELPATCE